MRAHDDDDESGHFRPDAWKVAWEATQDVPAPSCEVKAAAERLVFSEHLQQAMGWLLLTQIGVLLGSFGQVMSLGVCLLSWAIFMLEAGLKFGRNWAHTRFFFDVPCAYVPIHQEPAHDALSVFGRYLLSATLLEAALYVPYIFYVFMYWHHNRICLTGERFDVSNCQQGTNLLLYLLFFSVATVIVHWMTSLLTVWTFHSAMGVGIVAFFKEKKQRFKHRLSWPGNISHSCSCNRRGCQAGKQFRSPRSHFDRVLCLTWWVHMARHRHLSAVVASAQPGNCGLPGHWFESVVQLKRILVECAVNGAGDHVLNSAGPLWVSQEMALRALVSLAKQGRVETCREILRNEGFGVLVQVLREGKISSCRGLAAAAVAVLATQHEAIKKEGVDLTVAVIPLKRLLRTKEHELKEVALGALLNTALNDEQFVEVLSQFHSSDGIVDGSRGTFMSILMDHAHLGPTARCQELAIGLLARLAGDSTPARAALMDHDRTKHSGLELLIELLQHGLTTEIKASAAGVLSELAFKEGRAIGRGPYGESCIQALVQVLRDEPQIAYASARALCNLAIKWEENKPRIVSAGGIERFVGLLLKKEPLRRDDAQSQMQEQVQAEAARALWMLALHNPLHQERIAKADAIPPLVELLWNPRPKIHIQAVAALSALAWENKRNQDLIGQEGSRVFSRVVRLLVDIDDENMEEKVLEKVAVAMRSFADGNKSNQEKLLKAGARVQLENIAQKNQVYRAKTLKRVREAIEHLKEHNQA